MNINVTDLKRKSAFRPWTPSLRHINAYSVFQDLVESGELRLADKDGRILNHFDACLLLDEIHVKYQNGVIKVIKK